MSPVAFKTNADIEAEEMAASAAQEAAAAAQEPKLDRLTGYIRVLWDRAQRAKIKPEARMLMNLRARKGEYEPARLAAIKSMYPDGYEPVFMKLTETKCRAAEAWIRDILLQPGLEPPFDVRPTPVPELPEAVQMVIEEGAKNMIIQQVAQIAMATGQQISPEEMQMAFQQLLPEMEKMVQQGIRDKAREAAENMKLKINDQFHEGLWYEALSAIIYDIVTFGTAVMKGPMIQKMPVRIREFDQMSGTWRTRIEDRLVPVWERINPLLFYPSPDATSNRLPWCFEKISFTRKELSNLIGVPKYNTTAIREVLAAHRSGGLREMTMVDQTKAELEGRSSTAIWETENIDGLKFDGSAPGSYLLEWGFTPQEVPDAEKEYDIEAYVIDRWIIKAILNPDKLGEKYIYSAGFSESPDSFWHDGVPELIEHIQHIANGAARAIVQNTALAAGPMVEVNQDRLATGESFQLYPMKVTYSTTRGMMESPAVKFYQPEIVSHRLMEVFQFCLEAADDDSGIPRYTHTGETRGSGAGETSSGLSMLMSHSAKGIKNVIKNIDEGIIVKCVRSTFHYNMKWEEEDPTIFGDMQPFAKGSSSLIQKEQTAIRRTELLERTNNPADLQIMGLRGRAELLRKNLEGVDVEPDKIVAEEEELDAMMAAGAGAIPGETNPQPAGPGGPPAPAQRETDNAGAPVAGRDNQLFESPKGVKP